MKKLINDPDNVLPEMLEGIASTQPNVRYAKEHDVLIRADVDEIKQHQVTIISGGGSGHEPAHGGYVGKGMLTAAVCGGVFRSPTQGNILATIRECAGPMGVLLIVKNYGGDRLNFGHAAEMARAEGIDVKMVVVADDAALIGVTEIGARGIAGTVFVHKVAGALAEAGEDLETVAVAAERAANATLSMGVGLTPCIIPSDGKPGFKLRDDQIEMGLGIHGEKGLERKKLQPVDAIVAELLDKILENHKSVGKRVGLMVNNLGATPTMELQITARAAIDYLQTKDITVERVYTGPFMTSLEMAGISLSVIALDDSRLKSLDAPTEAPAWRPSPLEVVTGNKRFTKFKTHGIIKPKITRAADIGVTGEAIERGILALHDKLLENKNALNDLDKVSGDGDIGTNLCDAVVALKEALPDIPLQDIPAAFREIAAVMQKACGGTSGPLYSVFCLVVANTLEETGYKYPQNWAFALTKGAKAIGELGDSKVGDRTMLDALIPATEQLELAVGQGSSFDNAMFYAAIAAKKGAEATKEMKPKRGRASYMPDRVKGYPDPGAAAIQLIFETLAEEE